MGTLVNKEVRMEPHDWRRIASECKVAAMQFLLALPVERALAAQMLEAAKTFNGHANMLEIEGGGDVATVEVWDLSDEEEPGPAWPTIAAHLREAAGDNPKLMKVVDQIDRLHALSVEKGLPQVSLAEFEAELASVQA